MEIQVSLLSLQKSVMKSTITATTRSTKACKTPIISISMKMDLGILVHPLTRAHHRKDMYLMEPTAWIQTLLFILSVWRSVMSRQQL